MPTRHPIETEIAPSHCEELLQARVRRVDAGAVEAAMLLMELHDPRSLREALWLVDEGREVSATVFEVLAEAWDRYFHIRNMPWD